MNFFEITVSSLTALIAFFAAFIAYQQFKINKYKYKFDLFDKRFAVFIKFREFAQKVDEDGGKIKISEIQRFRFQILEHKFLFNTEFTEYISDFIENVKRLRTINVDLETREYENISELKKQELSELTNWFTIQIEYIEDRFYYYLSIKDL